MRKALNPEAEALLSAMPAMLATEANRLGGGRPCPLDLLALLRDFGMGLSVATTGADRYHSGALREGAYGWDIVVIRPPQALHSKGLTPRERFTIAHELGHYLIHARCNFRPTSQREYWRLEHICNEFAATLLAPCTAVNEVLRTDPREATEVLAAVQELRRSTRISFEAATRRLVAAMQRPVAVAGLSIDRLSVARNGRIRWMHENRHWMGAGRNRNIMHSHPFASALVLSKQLLIGQVRSIEMAETKSACVLRAGDEDVFIVAILANSQQAG